MIINDPKVVAEVRAAFDAYERALMDDDLAAMDILFHNAPTTVRYGLGEVLYGIDEIRDFRARRGGSPPRRLGRVEIATFGKDFAVANAEFFRDGAVARGRQSQTWVRFPEGWKVVAAHVSAEAGRS